MVQHGNHVFFVGTLNFLPVVLEFPLDRKTNNKAANHRDERRSQWRETDFYKYYSDDKIPRLIDSIFKA